MKNSTKKILIAVILITAISFAVNAQTHVSGGIWANTTWTLSNSPYIVDSSVVVLPGYILTIEPGVVVKFANGQGLEIRQAELIAMGTATDSITFTSNSTTPTPGIYGGVLLNGGTMPSQIGYCNFYYANHGINCWGLAIVVKHCKAMYNYDGISGTGNLDSCEFKYNTNMAAWGFDNVANCNFSNNYDGMFQCFHINNCIVDSSSNIGITMNNGTITNSFIRYGNIGVSQGNPVTIYNCVITNNQRGIELNAHLTMTYSTIDSNVVGIYNHQNLGAQNNYIGNCHIEYNVTGIDDRILNGSVGNGNVFTRNNIDNNDIGISFSEYPEGIDTFYCNTICNNTSFGFKWLSSLNTSCVVHNYWCTPDSASTEAVIYDVYDNLNCGFVYFMPIDSACSPVSTSINDITRGNLPFRIFPNPATDYLTIELPTNISKTEIKIFNMLGGLEYYSIVTMQKINIDVSTFASGIHTIQIATGNYIARQKFIRQ